jgi:basic amino acid/polyamine antiporter, APA family
LPTKKPISNTTKVAFNQLLRKKTVEAILNDSESQSEGEASLKKNLRLRDLVALAIAAIIGAGIFSTIGNASADGGPAVSLLFIFTAIACSFSALCYADFASRLPISGSAYTYAYASLGELVAWIIGWDLLMEYSVGNIAVAISWSDYLTSFLNGFNIHLPAFLTTDYLSASRGFAKASELLKNGSLLQNIPSNLQEAYNAWTHAPSVMGFRLIADIPAFMIVVFITWLVYIGIKESKTANNIMVVLKIGVVLLVILAGSFYVNPGNWSPFAPNGISGVLKGVSAVFFAYIGFDAISTTAEECRNPRRDLPRAMIISLIVCTVLYIAIALVLTGMVKYNELSVGDPLAFVFQRNNLNYLSGIIGFSAIVAMASVLLVFQVGQPRIWMSMSRDGLLPQKFSAIHPKYKTPWFSTLITGLVVGIPTLFMNLTEVTDLTSIGTLFAFVIVCAGVLKNERKQKSERSFYLPYINGKYVLPIILIVTTLAFLFFSPHALKNLFTFSGNWDTDRHKIPYLCFIALTLFTVYLTYIREYSLIPVLGLITNLYLMTELGYTNWLRFVIWLAVGLIIYFSYSYKKSKLHVK